MPLFQVRWLDYCPDEFSVNADCRHGGRLSLRLFSDGLGPQPHSDGSAMPALPISLWENVATSAFDLGVVEGNGGRHTWAR
jgi:hypothetical protein